MDDLIFEVFTILSNAIKVIGRFSSENWQGIVATSVFVATAFQGFIQRQHSRISVKPHLDTYYEISENQDPNRPSIQVKYFLINNGLGPAMVDSYLIKYDGEVVGDSDVRLIKDHFNSTFHSFLRSNKACRVIMQGSALRANNHIECFSLEVFSPTESDKHELIGKLMRYGLEVKYKSMYGEACPLLKRKTILRELKDY